MSHRTSPPRSNKKKRPQSSLGFRPTVIPTAEVGPAEFRGKWSPPRRRVEEPAEEDGGCLEIYRRSCVSRDRSASPEQPRSPSPQHVAPPPSPTVVHGGGLSPRFAAMREGYVSSTSRAAEESRALGESPVPLSNMRRSSPHPQPPRQPRSPTPRAPGAGHRTSSCPRASPLPHWPQPRHRPPRARPHCLLNPNVTLILTLSLPLTRTLEACRLHRRDAVRGCRSMAPGGLLIPD